MKIKVFQTHKKSSLTYHFVQDKFCVNQENNTIAIADGTTQSFRSEFWSEKLVQEFCKNPTFQEEEFYQFTKQIASDIQSVQPELSANIAIASLERKKFSEGSTSTFLGIQFRDKQHVDVINIGDCTIFRLHKNGDITPFPHESIQELNGNQSFLNTVNLLKDEPDSFEISKTTIQLESGDSLLLCSDAVSKLFLSDSLWINELVNLESFDSFIEKIEGLWKANLLEEDDITIIFISDQIERSMTIIPPKDFSFPEPIPTRTFVPFNEGDSNLNFTAMDIQTIMHNFNGIKNDFEEIKKKQRLHEILLICIVGLLSLIFIILVLQFFNLSTDQKKSPSPNKEILEQSSAGKKSSDITRKKNQ